MGPSGVAPATVALLLLSCSLATATLEKAYHHVPTFDLDDLYTGRRDEELANVLSTTGLISVSSPSASSGYLASRDAALGGLCSCLAASQPVEDVPSVERVSLGDGATVRTTIATAAEGRTPLPLSSESLLGELSCAAGTLRGMEGLRGDAALASGAFMVAFDRLVGRDNVLLRTKGGTEEEPREYLSLSSVVEEATNLEHFHVYSREGDKNQGPYHEAETLELHTDAGLFLTFVPALPCSEADGEDESFLVAVPGEDSVRRAVFPQEVIAIMLGVGAEHWLEGNMNSLKLRATKHAVSMRDGQSRAWYGMMHLVPPDVIVERSTGSTLADVRSAMAAAAAANVGTHVDIGCGSHSVERHGIDQDVSVSTQRLLQHVDASECDNENNFFCWLSCLEIPDVPEGQEEAAKNGDLSLYCAQTELYAADNILPDAVQDCTGPDGVPGSIMNVKCEGMWAETDPAAPASKVDVAAVIDNDQLGDGADDGDEQTHHGNMTGHGGMDMDSGNTTGHDDMIKGNTTGHDDMEGNMTGHDDTDMVGEGMAMGGEGMGSEEEVAMEDQRTNTAANAESSADASLGIVMSLVVLALSTVSLANL